MQNFRGGVQGYPSIDRPWKKYYSDVSVDESRVGRTVYQYVVENNIDYMDTNAISYKGKEITYGTMIDYADQVAESLLRYGIKTGDRIMMAATGVPEVIYILLACSKLGICVEMINFSLDPSSIKNHILTSEAKLVFCLDRIHEKIKGIIGERDIDTIVIPAAQSLSPLVRFLDGLSHKIDRSYGKTISYSEFLVRDCSKSVVAVSESGQPYIVVYSSGTTGMPKGIVHTNRSYTAMAEEYSLCEYPFSRGDGFLNQLPFFIASALSFFTLASIMVGVRVILEPQYDPVIWLKDIVKYRPRVIFGTPSFWLAALENPVVIEDLSFAKIIISGGEPLDIRLEGQINKWLTERGFQSKLTVGYGMSELNGTITTSSFKYHEEGTNGIPLPHVVVGVFDTKTGQELEYNRLGELMAQSPCEMKEYAGMPDKTEQFRWKDAQGRVWARTGDIGKINENGEVFVFGRAVDSIDVNDRIVYFFEIETEVLKYDSIQKCKVVSGCNGEVSVNIIAASNSSKIDETEIIMHLSRCFEISSDLFRVRIWEKFPLNANGKIDKIKLKES